MAELDLQHCFLGNPGAEKLASCIALSCIKSLELRGNYIGCSAIAALMTPLEKVKLRRLGLAWNSIGDEGASRLAGALSKMPTLAELDLAYNRLGDPGAQALARALRDQGLGLWDAEVAVPAGKGKSKQVKGGLQRLDVQFNAIADLGARALKEACVRVGKNVAAVVLVLAGNRGASARQLLVA